MGSRKRWTLRGKIEAALSGFVIVGLLMVLLIPDFLMRHYMMTACVLLPLALVAFFLTLGDPKPTKTIEENRAQMREHLERWQRDDPDGFADYQRGLRERNG